MNKKAYEIIKEMYEEVQAKRIVEALEKADLLKEEPKPRKAWVCLECGRSWLLHDTDPIIKSGGHTLFAGFAGSMGITCGGIPWKAVESPIGDEGEME